MGKCSTARLPSLSASIAYRTEDGPCAPYTFSLDIAILSKAPAALASESAPSPSDNDPSLDAVVLADTDGRTPEREPAMGLAVPGRIDSRRTAAVLMARSSSGLAVSKIRYPSAEVDSPLVIPIPPPVVLCDSQPTEPEPRPEPTLLRAADSESNPSGDWLDMDRPKIEAPSPLIPTNPLSRAPRNPARRTMPPTPLPAPMAEAFSIAVLTLSSRCQCTSGGTLDISTVLPDASTCGT